MRNPRIEEEADLPEQEPAIDEDRDLPTEPESESGGERLATVDVDTFTIPHLDVTLSKTPTSLSAAAASKARELATQHGVHLRAT